MDFNINEIKSEIILNYKKIFDNSVSPKYIDFGNGIDFENGVDLFFKLVLFKANNNKLDGLNKTVLNALNESLITRKGDLNALKILIEELEPFLKKVIYIKSDFLENYVDDHTKTLMPLFKILRLDEDLNNNTVRYSEQNLDSFKGQRDFRFHLCNSWLIRNQVHNSPNWDNVEIAQNLRDILVVYLYASLKDFNSLDGKLANVPLPNKQVKDEHENLFDDPKIKPLYDFISFNHETYEIRTEIVRSYILHFLSEQSSKVKLDQIQKTCNQQFKTSTEKDFYERTLRDLKAADKVLISGLFDDEYELTEDENNRIKKVKEQFEFQKELFFYELGEVLKPFSLERRIDEIVGKLTHLFELNYNIDLDEISSRGFEATDNVNNITAFTNFLRTLVPDKKSAEELFKKTIILCGENDFLHRITASQVFGKATNPDQIDQYIRQQERIIYLDTNILLYILCYWYEDSSSFENIYYKVAKEFLKFVEDRDNIKLRTSNLYLLEIAYQLKEALLLVPFESLGLFKRVSNSNNIFYKYYIHLKEDNLLDDEINDFADFLNQFGGLSTDDLLDKNYLSKISNSVREIIETSGFHIKVVDLPSYQYEVAFEEFKNALPFPRPPETINNDAKLICHLSSKNSHNNEPILATWDTIFFSVRRKYLSKNKNAGKWHLFTLSKLINHLQLLEFKINPESVTNDFLTLSDSFNISEKTKQTLDIFNELFDISKEERRRYMNKLQEFNSKYIFNLHNAAEDSAEESIENKPIEKLIMELNKYYANKNTQFSFKDFKLIFPEKDLFDKVVSIFEEELEFFIRNRHFSSTMFSRVDELIRELKNK